MLKFAAKKEKKDKRGSRLVHTPSQDSTSSIDSQDGHVSSIVKIGTVEVDGDQEDGHVSDSALSDTGTVKRRRSSKLDPKNSSMQRYSNGAALSENSSPIPFKAFISGGNYF